MRVDFGRVFGSPTDEFTAPVVRTYVQTRHAEQPYIRFPRGFVQAKGCRPDPALWTDHFFPGWNRDWTTQATTFSGEGLYRVGQTDKVLFYVVIL